MTELELIRTREDSKLYALPGVGNLRVGGWLTRRVEASTGGESYTFDKRGFFSPYFQAIDAETGAVVGELHPRVIRRGGTVTWRGAEWALRPAAALRERYALSAPGSGHEVATIEGRGWGKRPVRVSTDDAAGIDPGLLLFVVFAVRILGEDANSTSASSVAAMG